MKRVLLVFIVFFLSFSTAQAKIVTQEIKYDADQTQLVGFLAYDDAIGVNTPGIIVVHEWWGQNAYARKRARMLAELGYVAFAVDMFGDGKTADHPDDAKAFVEEATKNYDHAAKVFHAGLKVLRGQTMVDKNRIAAIGYCFGGGTVLNMARLGADLKGVVSFHGSLASPFRAEKGKIKARVLVLNGADDKLITEDQIADFQKEMQETQADLRFINYPGALHSFTNPDADEFAEKFNMPIGYNETADQESWKEMRQFFDEIF